MPFGAILHRTCRLDAGKLHWYIDAPRLGASERRRDGEQAGVAGASVARWLLRILVATAGVVVGFALTATTAQADTKSAPLGTSVGKLTKKVRPAAGSSSPAKVKKKVVAQSSAPKAKIRIRARATPVKRVARKVAPVRTQRVAKVARTVARKSTRPVTIRPRISNVAKKTSTARVSRKAIAKAHPAQRVAAVKTKINKAPSKIIESPVRKVTTAKRSTSPKLAEVVRPVQANAGEAMRKQLGVEPARTVPAIEVGGLAVGGRGPSVVTPGIKVSLPPAQISLPPVEVTVPLLNLPTVTLPPVELPRVTMPPNELPGVTVPRTDLPSLTRPGSRAAVAGPARQVDQRAGPADTASVPQTQEQTARTTGAGTVSMVSTAHTLRLSVEAWAMTSIGSPATVIVVELRQHVRALDAASIGPTTVLIIAAAIGAAASGTASSGSAGAGGLTVISAALRLPALSGSRRLSGRLRKSAFRTPHRPGFSPD